MGRRKQRDDDLRKLGYSFPEEPRRSFVDTVVELAVEFAAELFVLAVGLIILWVLLG